MAKYELKARAERMADTRRRIVEATLKLHQTLGPAHTSISAIAAAAGVQRHTVYSHFPDERDIYMACGSLFARRNPLPPVAPWREIAGQSARTHRALLEVYGFFRDHERELSPIIRDMPLIPQLVGKRFAPYRESVVAVVTDGWQLRGKRAVSVRALLDVALRFETWRALAREDGLSDVEAAATMAEAVLCVAGKGSAGFR